MSVIPPQEGQPRPSDANVGGVPESKDQNIPTSLLPEAVSYASPRRAEPYIPEPSVEPEDRPRIVAKTGSFAGLGPLPQQPAGTAQRRSTWPGVYVERPGTVTAAAVILYLSAAAGLFLCFVTNQSLAEQGGTSGSVGFVLFAVLVGSAVLNVVLGINLQLGRNWARITTLVFCWLGVALAVIQAVAGSPGSLLSLPLNAAVLALLYSQSSQTYFYHSQ